MDYNKLLGIMLMVVGSVLFVLVAGDFIVRALLAFAALYIINYGMKLRGMSPLILIAKSWWARRFRF